MKSLIAIAISLCSLTAFSAELGAVDSLLSVLPQGNHVGENCSVTANLLEYPVRSVVVTVSNEKASVFKVVSDNTDFFFKHGKKEFIQTDRYSIDDTRSSFVERIVRTVLAEDDKLYVVVSEQVTVNRESRSDVAECLINL